MLELYNEEIRDLLVSNDKKLSIHLDKNGNNYVKGLSWIEVKTEKDCMNMLDRGSGNKEVASTEMNAGSSRSHCIFSIVIESCEELPNGEQAIKKGKLNLVDLAGSERQKKTKATGDRLKEAKSINLSLTNLGNVISALVDGKSKHIPYRNSKLTRLLEDSLGGNAKTLMFAAVGPADYNYDESLNTLRYANRAKNIKNKPKVNRNPKDAKIKEMQDEIELLRQQLQNAITGQPGTTPGMMGTGLGALSGAGGGDFNQYSELEEKLRQEAEEIERQTEEERKKIMAMNNIDNKKKEELMKKMKEHAEKEEETRKHKEELLEKLKTKQDRILRGQQQNAEELQKYNDELEKMRNQIEAKRKHQENLQKEIANAQVVAEEIKAKMQNQKEGVSLKAQSLAKLSTLVEQQQEYYEELVDAHNADIQELVDFVH